jgi:16S rRNA (adenine1518-N6/adenine1519-N6)-dimethyltransferase
MSLDQIERLLRQHRISPNKVLGQNFLIEPLLYPKLRIYAGLGESDVVLDVGAGFGFLAKYLSDKCKAVVAVEKDPEVFRLLHEQVKGISNITVIEGDILRAPLPQFNKVIALPPYYLSSQLVTWILDHKVDCAVLVVQKEFAQRLVAPIGSEGYGWLTVVTAQKAESQLLDMVPKEMFHPPPEVDSVILNLKPYASKPFEVKDGAFFVRLTKCLFTERNRKLAKALALFLKSNLQIDKKAAEKLAQNQRHHDKRVRELSPTDFGELANALCN